MDARRATKATAHHLAPIVYTLVTKSGEYRDVHSKEAEIKRELKQRKHLRRNAERLGLTAVTSEQAELFE